MPLLHGMYACCLQANPHPLEGQGPWACIAEQAAIFATCLQVYGPDGLGKLAKGGHPRRLHDDSGQAHTGNVTKPEAVTAIVHEVAEVRRLAAQPSLAVIVSAYWRVLHRRSELPVAQCAGTASPRPNVSALFGRRG